MNLSNYLTPVLVKKWLNKDLVDQYQDKKEFVVKV